MSYACLFGYTVQIEAAAALLSGLQLFYPSSTQLCTLVTSLVSAPQQPLADHATHTTGAAAARLYLLNPVLQRLCDDDALSASLLSDCEVSSVNNTAAAAAAALVTLVQQLISHVAFGAAVELQPEHSTESDAPMANGTATAVTKPAPATHALYVKLLLSLMKRIMHWAATHDPAAAQQQRFANCTSAASAVWRRAEVADTEPTSTSAVLAWECLASCAVALLSAADAVLATAPAELSSTLLFTVLPAVISGLMPFARAPPLAERLMTPVLATLQRLDAACHACPRAVAADALCTTSSSEAYKLPWLLSLAKTAACLAGQLCATVAIGDTAATYKLERAVRAQPVLTQWLTLPLLSGGLDDAAQERAALLTQHSFGNSSSEHCAAQARKQATVAAADASADVSSLLVVTAAACAALTPAYTVIRRQAHAGADSALFSAAESAVFAALLKHSGATTAAVVVAVQSRTAQRQMRAVWRATAALGTWLWQQRSALRASDAPASVTAALFVAAADAALFLSCFRAAPAPALWPATLPKRWRRVLAVVRAAVRLQRHCRDSSSAASSCPQCFAVCAFVVAVAAPAHSNSSSNDSSSSSSGSSGSSSSGSSSSSMLSTVVLLTVSGYDRAVRQAAGLAGFSTLLQCLNLQSLRADALQALPPALRNASAVRTAVATSLAAVDSSAVQRVTAQRAQLHTTLLQLLELICNKAAVSSSVDCRTLALVLDAIVPALNVSSTEQWHQCIEPALTLAALARVITALDAALAAPAPAAADTTTAAAAAVAAAVLPTRVGRHKAAVTAATLQPLQLSPAALKARDRALRNCRSAAWTALRLLALHPQACTAAAEALLPQLRRAVDAASAATVAAATASAVSVLGPAETATAAAAAAAAVTGSWSDVQDSSASGASLSLSPPTGHRRRCQELIGPPRRFTTAQVGVTSITIRL
jgi:hypothetical protein